MIPRDLIQVVFKLAVSDGIINTDDALLFCFFKPNVLCNIEVKSNSDFDLLLVPRARACLPLRPSRCTVPHFFQISGGHVTVHAQMERT